ncbi:MAG TPA: HAD family phosphatase [Firmicutes bacterium]|nr:HAD family phosphatase [Bacillota bacterium]
MNLATVRLMAVDLDGTLLGGVGTASGDIQTELLSVIALAHQQGLAFALVTGRNLDYVVRLLARYPVLEQCLSGAVTEERFVYTTRQGSLEPLSEWNDQMLQIELEALSIAQRYVAHRWQELQHLDPRLTRHQIENEDDRGYVEIVCSTSSKCRQVARALQDGLPVGLQVMRNIYGIKIRSQAVGKGMALEKLGRLLRFSPDRILAIGDGENDLSMLDGHYGFQAATVANAQDVVADCIRRNGGLIATQPCGAGVAEIITRWLDAQGRLVG